MGDVVKLPSGIGVSPTFVGRGSKIEKADILPIFWGPSWPGVGGQLGPWSITTALRGMTGAYLEGIKQYGCTGPHTVRDPQVDGSAGGALLLPSPGPGVDQIKWLGDSVTNYVKGLVDDDRIANVDDNHELVVIVFLDATVSVPSTFDVAGNVSRTFTGANSKVEIFELLDDNIRFMRCWVVTGGRTFAQIMETASHELVEAMTDPFGSGWHQVTPPPAQGAGQLTDVCNQSGVSDQVPVTAYWSKDDGACIIPTSATRHLALSQRLDQHRPHQGPEREALVDLGVLCGAQTFSYHEITYQNSMTITADAVGYEDPEFTWLINLSPMGAEATLSATWDLPPASDRLGVVVSVLTHPATAEMTIQRLANHQFVLGIGPNAGNVSFRVDVAVKESFDTGDAGGEFATRRRAMLEIDLLCQELVWGEGYDQFKKNCQKIQHLAETPALVIGPPRAGDPPDLVERVSEILERGRRAQLDELASGLAEMRPEIADAANALLREQ